MRGEVLPSNVFCTNRIQSLNTASVTLPRVQGANTSGGSSTVKLVTKPSKGRMSPSWSNSSGAQYLPSCA